MVKRELSVAEAMKSFHTILDPHRYCPTSVSYCNHTVIGGAVSRRVDWLFVPCVLSYLIAAKYFPRLCLLSVPENICRVPLFFDNVRNPPSKHLLPAPEYWRSISILVLNTVSGLQLPSCCPLNPQQ